MDPHRGRRRLRCHRGPRQGGQQLEREAEVWGNISGPWQSWANLRLGQRTRFFNGRDFDEVDPDLFRGPSHRQRGFGMFARKGDQIDFANTRPGEQLLFEPRLNLNFGRHIKVDLEHEFNQLEVDGGILFTANISELRFVYQFNRRTFVRLISQYLDLERDPTLYTNTVEAQTRPVTCSTSCCSPTRSTPAPSLFLGYSDNYVDDPTPTRSKRSEVTQVASCSRVARCL